MFRRSSTWQRVVAALICAGGRANVAAAQPSVASAEGPSTGLTVRFDGPSSCGEPTRLLEKTRELLGASAAAPWVEVDATVSQTRVDQFTLHLHLRGEVSGERRLGARNCEEALQAGAVVIALAIDPDAVARAQHDDQTSGSAAPSEATDNTSPESQSPAENATETPDTSDTFEPSDPYDPVDSPWGSIDVRPYLSVGGRVSTGVKPTPGLGGQVELGLELGGVLVGGSVYTAPSTSVDHEAAGPVQWREFGGALRLCGRFVHMQSVDLHGCGGASMVWLSARAEDLPESELQRARLTSVTGEVLLSVHLMPPLSLAAAAGLSVPTTEPRFVAETPNGDVVVVFEPDLGLVATLGARLSWD